MTTFYLVRHGTCDGLGEMLWGRTAGIHLNKEGNAQVQQLAKRFSNIKLDAIYSSPLERALETAKAIARPAKLEVKQSPAFNEIDFGYWSGMSFEALSLDKLWRQFNTQRSITKIPGGESLQAVQARANAELERLSEQHQNSRVVIVSHADVIKAAVGYVAGTPVDLLQRYEVLPGSVSIIVTDERDTKLLAVNSRFEPT
ncbi:MAG TPA: histidine phosphatase family protein [Pyrinomonadaceae bacterium]|nr:histidine phosphatase family protein [Pyrinomonadaceae bacterium]